MAKRVIFRLYATSDLDLLYMSYNPVINFSQIAKSSLKSYADNIPFTNTPFLGGESHYSIPHKIIMKEVTIYLDPNEDAKIIKMLSKVKNKTAFIKYVVRYYAYKSVFPQRDTVSDIYLADKSESGHLVESAPPEILPQFMYGNIASAIPEIVKAQEPVTEEKSKTTALMDSGTDLYHKDINNSADDDDDELASMLLGVGGIN